MVFNFVKRIVSYLVVILVLPFSNAVFAHMDEAKITSLKHIEDIAAARFGDDAASNVVLWHKMLRNSSNLSDQEKINNINKFFNLRVYYDEDKRIWKKADYWATPLETLARARGDCEDFTIAKYVSLKLLNIPEEKLKLTYVKLSTSDGDKTDSQPHMVLAYYPDETADPLILDNLNGRILPASERPELKTIFSFNDSALWVAGQPSEFKPQHRLNRWRDVLNRMHSEGL